MNTPPPAPTLSRRVRINLTPRVAATGLAVSVAVLLVVVVLSLLRGSDEGVAGLPPSGGTPTPVTVPDASGTPSPSMSPVTPGSPGATVGPKPTAKPTTAPVSFPVRGYASSVLMAPGPNGGVYVSVPGDDRTRVALIGTDGAVGRGWPVDLGVSWCTQFLTAGDGTLRVVCEAPQPDDGLQAPVTRIFGIDAAGRALPGWPVDIEGSMYMSGVPMATMHGTDVVLAVRQYAGDVEEEGVVEPPLLVIVDRDGRVNVSEEPEGLTCCSSDVVPGPGVGYIINRDYFGEGSSQVIAFDLDAVLWKTSIDAIVSNPAFDDAGNAYFSAWRLGFDRAQIFVLDPAGRVTRAADLAIGSTNGWSGAGSEHPALPTVSNDGSVVVFDDTDGTVVMAVDPSSNPRGGWPYRTPVEIAQDGFCPGEDVGCGVASVAPKTGANGVVYVALSPDGSSSGGSLIAIASDGRIVDGWPVGLTRRGAGFWKTLVGSDGGVWALAAEPEGPESYSGTLLSIAPDSTIRGKLTIVEP